MDQSGNGPQNLWNKKILKIYKNINLLEWHILLLVIVLLIIKF